MILLWAEETNCHPEVKECYHLNVTFYSSCFALLLQLDIVTGETTTLISPTKPS